MSKTIVCMRHGDTPWGRGAMPDIERPLSSKGETEVATMAQRITAEGYLPELIVCSTAVRTRATAAIIQASIAPLAVPVVFEPVLYEADVADLWDSIWQLNEAVSNVLMIGHNPSIELLGRELHPTFKHGFPSAACALFQFGVATWLDVQPNAATHWEYDYPNNNGDKRIWNR